MHHPVASQSPADGPDDSPSVRRRQRRPKVFAVIVASVTWLGMCLLIYPMTASWVSQLNQSKVVSDYDNRTDSHQQTTSIAQQLADAHRYNDALKTGASVEANHNKPTGQGASTSTLDYNQLLRIDSSGVMGRIRIPSINVDLPIYHGTDDATLLKGIGHLQGTSLPVGGDGTHAVLTGHRGLANATMFTNLNEVRVGDTFTITVLGETLTYRVVSSVVVQPGQTEALRAEAGKDLVTLVTCTPLGINTQRILVTGERVLPTPPSDVAVAHRKPDIPGFPWWAVVFLGGTAGLGVYVWRAR